MSLVGRKYIKEEVIMFDRRTEKIGTGVQRRSLVQHLLVQANLPHHDVWLALEGYKGNYLWEEAD